MKINKIHELAEDIVNIVTYDYAGYNEISNKRVHRDYLNNITNGMDYNEFYKITDRYLKIFKDGHLRIKDNTGEILKNNFKVRRFKNKLYVTESTKNSPVQVGESITAIDEKEIDYIARKNQDILDESPERQDFSFILDHGREITLSNGKKINLIKDKTYLSHKSKYVFHKINQETMYLKFNDFNNTTEINNKIDIYREELRNSKNLLIDLRENKGGNDNSYFGLLDYVFKDKKYYSELKKEKDFIYYNATKRNLYLRKKMLFSFLNPNHMKDTMLDKLIKKEIAFFEDNLGKGLVPYNDSEDIDFFINGKNKPQRIIVLTDYFCASSGENFVELVQKSSKVTVIGRNTMGVTDYSNCCEENKGDFSIIYPISKRSYVDYGLGIQGKGIKADIYIPWTPELIKEDQDLALALKIFKKSSI